MAAAVAAALAGATAASSSAESQGGGTSGRVLHATFLSFPDYMDPQLSYTFEGWNAMQNVYIPLLTFRHASGKAGSEVIPGLAKALPRITNDGKTYTLFLRKGLRYSDGTPVRASDFEYAVERTFRLNSGGSVFYTDIVGAERLWQTKRRGIRGIVTNDKTGKIVIHLIRPQGTFADELALMFVAPVPTTTPMHELFYRPPAATGPYVITSVDEAGWNYGRNPDWSTHNEQLMPQLPSGHVDRIEVEVVRNGEAQINGVLDGKFDWMQNPPASQPISRACEAVQR